MRFAWVTDDKIDENRNVITSSDTLDKIPSGDTYFPTILGQGTHGLIINSRYISENTKKLIDSVNDLNQMIAIANAIEHDINLVSNMIEESEMCYYLDAISWLRFWSGCGHSFYVSK